MNNSEIYNLDLSNIYDELSNEEITQEMSNMIEYDNIKINFENNLLSTNIFTLEKKRKGRIRRNSSERKIHSKIDLDNIRNRIKISLFNFIIHFFNALLKKLFSKKSEFKFINYKDKNVKTSKDLRIQLKKKMSEILSLDIQKNYKNLKKEYNKQLLIKILKKIKELNNSNEYEELFNITLLDFYKKIYLSKNRIELEKKYGLTKDIELFYDFFDRLNEDYEYKKKFELTALNLPKFAKLEYKFKNTKYNKNINNKKESNNIVPYKNENIFDTPFDIANNESFTESIDNNEFHYLGNKRF
jgi:hypothetical protein